MMTLTFNAISKKLLGSRYERVGKGTLAALILFTAFYGLEISLSIAPRMFYFMITAFSSGIVLQALFSDSNAKNLLGLFLLPVSNMDFNLAYIMSVASYTLMTKVLPLLAIYLAVSEWTAWQLVIFIFCFMNSVLTAAVIFICLKRKHFLILIAIITAEAAWCLIQGNSIIYAAGIITCIPVLTVILLNTDFHVFYNNPKPSKRVKKSRFRHRFTIIYFLRYMTAHKNYLLNTIVMWAAACFLPFILGNIEGIDIMPLGLAILTFNTPLGILLSSDPGLERAVRTLPRQARMFCIPYCIFVCIINAVTDSIFFACSYFIHGDIPYPIFLVAGVFSLSSAVLTVTIEWLKPIRKWKIESDLWHHPRKYIVPAIMIFCAVAIIALP